MIKKSVGLWVVLLSFYHFGFSQVDTSFVYKTGLPYGTLDIRIAKSATRFYYLQENVTFSYRESSPGVKTNTYKDMTTWDSSPFSQGNLREKNGTADAFIMNYRLLYPVGYNPGYSEGYPLIVMVHGLGERGNCWDNNCYWADRTWKPSTNTPAAPTTATLELLNNDHNLLHGGNIHLQMRNAAGTKLPNDPTLPDRSFPGFVLFPQNLNGWDANQDMDVIKLVRLVSKKYKIDPDRIYIHGLSNGGAAVYDIIKRAPWLFSAAATMSAVSDGSIIANNLTSKVANIPLWTFQGGLDKSPTPAKTEGYIKRFREAGMSVRYSKYMNLAHGTWGTAYNEPDFFLWLRSKHKSEIHVFADNPTLCQTTGQGARLELAEGFLAYQWERNGTIISGATSAFYVATTAGTYRARFSRKSRTPAEADWNQWSKPVTVTVSNPAQAQIEQIGTVLLKDLNNFGDARLKSAGIADHYYWYKDGVLLNLPGTQDDTTRNPIIKAGDCSTGTCAGNGVYTLVTAGFNNCPSPVSAAKYIFFNNQAPVNITAPTTFTGNSTGASTTTVNWTDASSNENGFEIWRRKVITTTTFTKWVMPKLTNANVTSFNDSGLEPSSTYQYKIRAVSNSGRSNYTPSASNQYLVITTQGDTQAPSVPQNLTAAGTAIKEITLSWQASTDNTGIREYIINYGSTVINTGSNATTYRIANLPLNSTFTFTVKAKDLGGNLSGTSNSATATTYVNGLYYEHTTGAFSDIDLIDWTVAEFKGKVDNFSLAPRTQDDYFNFEFEGYLYITAGGSYQFQTTSDDGSRITLNDVIVVDNDGKHGTVTVTGAAVTLSSGAQFINVKYFDYSGGQNLTVRYKGPDTGNAFVAIPNAALKSGTSSSSSMTMASTEPAETVAAPENALDVSVYPNPLTSSSELTVQLTSLDAAPIRVKVLDFMGNTYYDNVSEANELSQGVKIEAAQKLKNGLYIIMIQQDKKVTKKVVMVKN